jgi:hypothetical protein
MPLSLPLPHLIGFCAGITLFACGGRTQPSDSTWSSDSWEDTSLNSSADVAAPGVNQPSLPTSNPPPTPPSTVEAESVDPEFSDPPPAPPPVLSPTDRASRYELIYPTPFTYGPHSSKIDVELDTTTEQWCLTIPPDRFGRLGALFDNGFGLTFGSVTPSGRQLPFDLAARGVTSLRVSVHTTEYLLRASLVEVPPVNYFQGKAFSAATLLHGDGEFHIPMDDFADFRPARFYALRFEFLDTYPYDDTLCIGNVAFLNASGSVVVEAAVGLDWGPAPP